MLAYPSQSASDASALDLGHNVHDPQVQILRNLEVLAVFGNLDIGKDIKVERVRSVPDEPKKEKVEEEPAEVTEIPPPLVSMELKKRWSYFIRKVYETDPIVCPKGSAEMPIISSIDQPES